MRVLLVSTEFPPGPGGIGTHAHQLASGLHDLGWEVLALTSQDYARDEEVSTFNCRQPFPIVRFRRIPVAPFEAVYREWVLAHCIQRHSPDVLIASGSQSVLLVAGRLLGARLPLVAVGHGTEFGSARGLKAAALRVAFRSATAVVCVSEFTREQMHLRGVQPALERVIPNGADPKRFRVLEEADAKASRASLGLPDAPLLVTVGNVTRRKGQDIVVRALPDLLGRFPAVQYAMAGLPSLGEETRRLAADLGVAERVHVLGRLDDAALVRLLNVADVFVMTSRRTSEGDIEGYGIAVVEAALCGLPAVVTTGSGLVEAISDGITGLCVPSEDPAATARAIGLLLADDALRRRMGEAARRRAETDQTWKGRVEAYDALLRDAVRRQKDASRTVFSASSRP